MIIIAFVYLQTVLFIGDTTFYCVPEFNTEAEFNDSFKNESIVDKSTLFSISDLPKYKNGKHSMTYKLGDNYGVMFSEPKKVIKKSDECLGITNPYR